MSAKSKQPYFNEENRYNRPFTTRIVDKSLYNEIMARWRSGQLDSIIIHKKGEEQSKFFIRNIQSIYKEFEIYGHYCISIVFEIDTQLVDDGKYK